MTNAGTGSPVFSKR